MEKIPAYGRLRDRVDAEADLFADHTFADPASRPVKWTPQRMFNLPDNGF
jgi:hypothetical protein